LDSPEAPQVQRDIKAYDWAAMKEHTPMDLANGLDAGTQTQRQTEALKVARKIPTGTLDDKGDADYETLNRHVIYEINEGTAHDFVNTGLNVNTFYNNEVVTESESEIKNLTGAEVLTSKGGTTVRGNVKGKKQQDPSGNQVAAKDSDELLYIVKYPDGTISQSATVQTDENGEEYHSTFKAIMEHQI
jgi:hypothetical protein